MILKITQKQLTLGKPARSGVKFLRPVDRIVIHWIGPYPGQAVSTPWNWWENGNSATGKTDGTGIRASSHFIVKDADVIQCLPLDEVGFHSGDTRNFHCIGIEVIPMNTTGEFSKLTMNTLRLVIQHIRNEIGKDLMLERHHDGEQKKDCPRYYTPVTSFLESGGRVANPEGGQQRWENLVNFLNGGGNE
jgi:hypothetical protein